jgi:ribosomal subunit interface protein
MLVEVRFPRFELTEAILRHAEQRVEGRMGVARRLIRRVSVTVDDVNADRGGVDKVCRIVAHCRGGAVLVAEARHEDLYVAIDEASEKARREVVRELRKGTTRERAGGRLGSMVVA